MKAIVRFVGAEPVALGGVVSALVGLGTSFGLHLTADQVGAITAAVGAISALCARALVTPTQPKAQ